MVRAELFGEYVSAVLPEGRDTAEDAPFLYGTVAVVAVPLVLVMGVVFGRFWVNRRRSAS
jgi:hypothetical protein